VLYVDDEDSLVRLARRALGRLGHDIHGFTDPREALADFSANAGAYDVVVTDLSMPGMSGFDLANKLLALRPEIPVIVATGHLRPEDEVTAHTVGVRVLMEKPASIEDLGRQLDKLFRDKPAT
jgi:DNA-binding NtrC family response regulator